MLASSDPTNPGSRPHISSEESADETAVQGSLKPESIETKRRDRELKFISNAEIA